jgi:exodeoxyribonuclease VII large subunit
MKNDSIVIYTVSEITKRIKSALEDNFDNVWIEGEVSNYKKSLSGHVYLTIKDESARLKCVIFKNIAEKIEFELEDGLHILCFGRISVYETQGSYQLYLEKIEPKGYGALQLAFEQLKGKLEKEGLFKADAKKPIPILPRKIGVVTSSTGAAIRDILNVINRRFPNIHIIINPVRVQGKEASFEIAQAIEEFNKIKDVDVLIVGRGGGSLEDLWAFNEEVVARSIFKSRIPVISAVGHQTDFTISDFVADVRASTPSKAAEMVIAKKEELEERLLNYSRRLRSALKSYSQLLDRNLSRLTHSRYFRQPEELILQQQLSLDDLAGNLKRNFKIFTEMKRERLSDFDKSIFFKRPEVILKEPSRKFLETKDKLLKSSSQCIKLKRQDFRNGLAKLESLSPLAVLRRGYSITKDLKTNKIIKRIKDVREQDLIKTQLSDGQIQSVVKEVKKCRI